MATKLRFPRARLFARNAKFTGFKISALILTLMVLINGQAANTNNVTPQNKYLPYGPSDVYNTAFYITTTFDRDDNPAAADFSQYHQVFSTQVIDKDDCVFYSKFGLETPATKYSATCGEASRWDSALWNS